MLEARMKAAAEKNAKKTVVMMTEPAAALKMQAVHRGNLSRSGRLKLGGQPYSPSQRRRLEDALSIAVNASLGLEVGARLGFIARHVAAQHHGRTPPEAPPRVGKLNAKQSEELAPLLEAVQLAVCQCNTMRGLPLRNVAEHLFAQHMLEKNRPPQASKDEMRGAARRLGMRGGAARHATMKFTNLPDAPTPREAQEAEDKRIEAERTDPVTIRAREAGTKAFAKYDKQKRGFLKKEDLFECMLGMGQVPGTNKQQQQAYLDAEFAKADADQSGTVDFDEFVTFYVKVVHAEEAEKAARTAFARFDVSNDNQLQKRELFQVLVELGMVTGDTKLEKELNLEEEFKKADLDRNGSVDFEEFIAFYTVLRRRMWGADLQYKKDVLKAKRDFRKNVSQGFVYSEAVFEALQAGHCKLLSARWWLQRAGYERTVVERSGRKQGRWVHKRGATPLPCRQLLEAEAPDAFLNVGRLEELQAVFIDNLAKTKGAEKDGIGATPVVCASHCWHAPGSADPSGETMQAIADELARQMPAYEAWGYDDVGVFFDWCSVWQDTVDVQRTEEQEAGYEAAMKQMALLFSHKQTTVYLVQSKRVEPPRSTRGWPFYEESLVRLFKETPPPKRYRLPEAGPTNMWAKIVHVGADDEAASFRSQGPPLSPSRFIAEIASKVFTREADRALILADYRRTIEAGFAGLERLALARRGWGDAELVELAHVIREVDCPQVRELDLSANDMSAKGLEALGAAVAAGALHALEVLTLTDCSGLLALPATLVELHLLTTLKLDGCIGLQSLPASFAKFTGLRTLNITHCLKLINNVDGLKLLPATIKIITEKKEKKEKSSTPR